MQKGVRSDRKINSMLDNYLFQCDKIKYHYISKLYIYVTCHHSKIIWEVLLNINTKIYDYFSGIKQSVWYVFIENYTKQEMYSNKYIYEIITIPYIICKPKFKFKWIITRFVVNIIQNG